MLTAADTYRSGKRAGLAINLMVLSNGMRGLCSVISLLLLARDATSEFHDLTFILLVIRTLRRVVSGSGGKASPAFRDDGSSSEDALVGSSRC